MPNLNTIANLLDDIITAHEHYKTSMASWVMADHPKSGLIYERLTQSIVRSAACTKQANDMSGRLRAVSQPSAIKKTSRMLYQSMIN